MRALNLQCLRRAGWECINDFNKEVMPFGDHHESRFLLDGLSENGGQERKKTPTAYRGHRDDGCSVLSCDSGESRRQKECSKTLFVKIQICWQVPGGTREVCGIGREGWSGRVRGGAQPLGDDESPEKSQRGGKSWIERVATDDGLINSAVLLLG